MEGVNDLSSGKCLVQGQKNLFDISLYGIALYMFFALVFFFSGAEDHHAHVWHRCGGSKLATLKGHVNVVNCVAFSPANQQMLVSASDDHTIRVWKSRQLARLHKDDQPEQQRDLFRESTV